MAKPKMILLDEPSAGVSPALTELLMEDIRRAQEETGTTILIIEHNMHLVMSLCNPVIVMSEGRKLAEARRRRCSGTTKCSAPISGSRSRVAHEHPHC